MAFRFERVVEPLDRTSNELDGREHALESSHDDDFQWPVVAVDDSHRTRLRAESQPDGQCDRCLSSQRT